MGIHISTKTLLTGKICLFQKKRGGVGVQRVAVFMCLSSNLFISNGGNKIRWRGRVERQYGNTISQ